jgi:hypothetical protein
VEVLKDLKFLVEVEVEVVEVVEVQKYNFVALI